TESRCTEEPHERPTGGPERSSKRVPGRERAQRKLPTRRARRAPTAIPSPAAVGSTPRRSPRLPFHARVTSGNTLERVGARGPQPKGRYPPFRQRTTRAVQTHRDRPGPDPGKSVGLVAPCWVYGAWPVRN